MRSGPEKRGGEEAAGRGQDSPLRVPEISRCPEATLVSMRSGGTPGLKTPISGGRARDYLPISPLTLRLRKAP